MVAQVDGGTGHSGKKSPEIHFGLGNLDKAVPLRVEVRWRSTDGQIRDYSTELKPGWHTILLGTDRAAKTGGQS